MLSENRDGAFDVILGETELRFNATQVVVVLDVATVVDVLVVVEVVVVDVVEVLVVLVTFSQLEVTRLSKFM